MAPGAAPVTSAGAADRPERKQLWPEGRFRAIVELAPDATLVADRDGRIVLVNRRTEVLFGYSRADLLGQPVERLIPARFGATHRQHRTRYVAAPRTRPMGTNLQLFGQRQDGSEFPVEVSLSPLEDQGELWVIATVHDIRERLRVEAARAAAEAASEELRQLQAITDTALAQPSLDELLRAVLARLRDVLAVDNVAILLASDDGGTLTLYTAQGPEEVVAGQVRVPIEQEVAGRIAATRQPLVVDDLASVEVANPLLHEQFRSLAGVPLLVDDRLIGVVHADSAVSRRFTQDDVHLLQLVGARIALAIDRARLYAAEQAARQQAEAALARAQLSEARFRRLLESNIIGLAVVDAEQVVEANGALLRMWDAGREDLQAGRLRWRVLTAPEYAEATERAMKEALVEGACEPFETAYLRANGSRQAALVGVVRLEREPPRFVVFVIDLTERKWLEQEREEARARELAVREVNRQLDEFFATAAHDIRAPVTAVKGHAQVALRRFERLQSTEGAATGSQDTDNPDGPWQAVRDSLLDTNQSADRLVRLVALLFDIARARTGTLELQLALYDLAVLVREQAAALRAAVPNRTIRLELPDAGQQPVPVLVLADADRLGQVLSNYLTNALKYSPADRPVTVGLEVVEGRAVVTVQDEGPGLPWEEQSRVWELFHRAPGVEVQSDAGGLRGSLGLGLHICKRIVELHGGRVGVESEVGQGATFWFTLPLAAPLDAGSGAPVL